MPGITWPALPNPSNAQLFSLLYQFEKSQWYSRERILSHQMSQLMVLLDHCYRTIPFYRDRLHVLKEQGGRRLTPEQYRCVPLLTRNQLQEHGELLCSSRFRKRHGEAGWGRSSGSTGRSVAFQYNKITAMFYQALNVRFYLWHRRNFLHKTASIKMLRDKKDGTFFQRTPSWIVGYRSGPGINIDAQSPITDQLTVVQTEHPQHLLTYPSNLHALIKAGGSSGQLDSIREITTLGELCGPEVRDAARTVLGVEIKDMYSCMEAGMLASECPDNSGAYHVQSENIYLEILDENDGPCGPGEVGRVVITDLHNFSMPLIRYDIGDYAEVGTVCRCGRGLPLLNRIVGRTRNMLALPSGDQMWPVFPFSKWGQQVPFRQIQIIQESLHTLKVVIVCTNQIDDQGVCTLRDLVSDFLDNQFDVVVKQQCDEIPRSANGKFEDFKSLVTG